MKFDVIPQELRDCKQWVCWGYEQRGTGKPTKVPLTAGGYNASTTKEYDWSPFDEILEYQVDYEGIGFVFTKDDPYVGIDLDDCFVDGEIQKWAQPIIDLLSGTYSEISPSGNGLKFFLRGSIPFDKGKKIQIEDGAIEIYSFARFFTVTTQAYGPSVIAYGQKAIDWICETFIKPHEVVHVPQPQQMNGTHPAADYNSIPINERIARASKYLANVDPAIQGSNASATTYRAACVLARGFALPEEEVFNLLWFEYNPRCTGVNGPSPWTEQELRHKASEGMKSQDPLGNMLQNKMITQSYGSEINGICMPPAMNQMITPIQPQLNAPAPVIIHDDTDDQLTDEEFFQSCVPATGLMRDIFDYYWGTQNFRTNAMGLCISVTIMETILGRRVASHTDARTNDYNVVIAGTSSGKESCEKVTQLLIESGKEASNVENEFVLPPDVQSGNALLREVSEKRACVWICDEFGKHLKQMIDGRSNNAHAQQIATVLLKMYGKSASNYHGAAHASGSKSAVNQPHLVMLGMSTGSVFDYISADQIEDGLYGRLAFWPAVRPRFYKPNRPKPVPVGIGEQIGKWLRYTNGDLGWEHPSPPQIQMTPDALERWETHMDLIGERQGEEAEFRAGVWGRVGIRSMKLAMCHRCARFMDDPSATGINFQIELEDVEWGIRLSNYLARISCSLAEESVDDTHSHEAKAFILSKLPVGGEINQRMIHKNTRRFTSGDIKSAAEALEKEKIIAIKEIKPKNGGNVSIYFCDKRTGSASYFGSPTKIY